MKPMDEKDPDGKQNTINEPRNSVSDVAMNLPLLNGDNAVLGCEGIP